MDLRQVSCNLCLGSDFEPYLESSSCGRRLLRCRECGLVAAMGGSDSDSQTDAPKTPGTPRDPRTDQRRAAAVMRILQSGKILEIGCGRGGFLAALDPKQYGVVGVEALPADAFEARRKLKQCGSAGAILEGSVTDGHLTTESFDLVAMFGSVAHCPSPRATFMEVSRLLKPGGYAVIETPGLSSLTARIFGTRWPPLSDPSAGFFFTASTLERLAMTCGLTAGAVRLTLPIGWPTPGTLVYVARKTGDLCKSPLLGDLTPKVTRITPMGATGI